MEPWLIAMCTGGGGLGGLYALARYHWKLKLIQHALGEERGVQAVDAVARALHPGAAALRENRVARTRAKVPADPSTGPA